MRRATGRVVPVALAIVMVVAAGLGVAVCGTADAPAEEVALVAGGAAAAPSMTASALGRDVAPEVVDGPGDAVADELAAPRVGGRFGPALPRDGRTATWTLRLTRGGLPSSGTATITAGADAGRRVDVGTDGEVTIAGLVPGLAVVAISSAAGEDCFRRVLLRHRATVETEVDFGDHGWLRGVVRDTAGETIGGARVDVDGASVTTEADGRFVLPRTVGGPPVVTVVAPGRARHRQRVGRATGSLARDLDVDVTLRPGARVSLRVGAAPGETGPMLLVLAASGDPFEVTSGVPEPSYPWAERGALAVRPGDVVVLDDLPTCKLDVTLLGAASAATATAWCRPEEAVDVELAPRPYDESVDVRVHRSDRPVVGVAVRLVVDNPASARARVLGRLVDRMALPLLPASDVACTTDVDGVARFARPADGREAGHVEVTVGEVTVARRVGERDAEVVIDADRPAG